MATACGRFYLLGTLRIVVVVVVVGTIRLLTLKKERTWVMGSATSKHGERPKATAKPRGLSKLVLAVRPASVRAKIAEYERGGKVFTVAWSPYGTRLAGGGAQRAQNEHDGGGAPRGGWSCDA